MCGIGGIFSGSLDVPEESLLRKMLHLVRHRGPDEFGIYRGGGIGLAHARLSIIDLASGQQPMTNEDDSLWIAFNGEIFNFVELRERLEARGHRFRTRSDTETILHLYEEKGIGALEELNGQFAFALWDVRKKELLLARDRMGIRPLFYARAGRDWVFGSEIKALFADPRLTREIDPVALDDIFTFWSPLSPRTAFRGVYELPPGHYMRVGGGGDGIPRRYWELPLESDPPGARPVEHYAESLRELLVDSTRMQLRADVPVAAYLSGGLDSSVTASLIRNFTKSPLCTFSITFEDPEFDESDKQRIMSDHLGTTHRSVSCGYSDIAGAFPRVIWHTEVPVLRTAPAPLYLLSKLVRENSYKVVLTGEGADEILAGYDIFKEAKVRRFMEASPDSRIRPLLLQRLYPYLQNSPTRSLSYAKAFFGGSTAPYGKEFHSHSLRWKMTAMGKTFFSRELAGEIGEDDASHRVSRLFPADTGRRDSDWLNAAQEIEIRTLLSGYILSSQGDRMLMANSVEGRFPFLDHRVVEFCMRIPPGLRLRGLNEKYILRRSMADLLPREIGRMVKQPYRAPDAKSFLAGRKGDITAEMLSPDQIAAKGYFDPQQVARLVEKCRTGPGIGFKDNMAFVGILSVQLLDQMFLRDFSAKQEMDPARVRSIGPRSGK